MRTRLLSISAFQVLQSTSAVIPSSFPPGFLSSYNISGAPAVADVSPGTPQSSGVSPIPSPSSPVTSLGVIIGASVGGVVVTGLLVWIFVIIRQRRIILEPPSEKHKLPQSEGDISALPPAPAQALVQTSEDPVLPFVRMTIVAEAPSGDEATRSIAAPEGADGGDPYCSVDHGVGNVNQRQSLRDIQMDQPAESRTTTPFASTFEPPFPVTWVASLPPRRGGLLHAASLQSGMDRRSQQTSGLPSFATGPRSHRESEGDAFHSGLNSAANRRNGQSLDIMCRDRGSAFNGSAAAARSSITRSGPLPRLQHVQPPWATTTAWMAGKNPHSLRTICAFPS